MNTADYIVILLKDFYEELERDATGRYLSWEHCYEAFCNARGNRDADPNYLSLHLAFYLASWGMYRGSSFLLQKDYKVHIPIVEELLKPKYDPLVGIKCADFYKEENQKLLEELNEFLADTYGKIRTEVKADTIKNDVSGTLITKILMGTLGCVPAYDRYFISGIRKHDVAKGTYSIKSIMQLVEFYDDNEEKFQEVQNKTTINGLQYPQMKLLDLGFWKIGYDADVKK